MTLNQKVDIYKKLVAALGKGVKLAAVLDRLGETAERKKVEKRNEELAGLAGRIRKKIQKSWNIGAKTTLKKIHSSSKKLQTQIASMEKTKKTAGKVVKALGFIDDLIEIAKQVAKAIA